MKFTAEEFRDRLPLPGNEKWKHGIWDVEAFRKGKVSLVLFAPRGEDFQTVHDEDEFYFIVSGSGELLIEDQRNKFHAGDTFFVPAGVFHHFENFTDDFVTWAVFF
jgi:mannose-6-phosphate isomerase-like protein (cupin superfamily)